MQSDATDKTKKRRTSATQLTLISLSRMKEEDPIVIKVQENHIGGNQLCYWMGRNTSMHDLMLDYCDRTGAVYEYLRFTYDGCRVSPDNTADDLEMEDEDIIDVFSYMGGG